MGKSIGIGPASYLASIYKPYALVLVSTFTSIKEVVADKIPLLSTLIEGHFDNNTAFKHIKCPTCLIHGEDDTLISWKHSQTLFNVMKEAWESEGNINAF